MIGRRSAQRRFHVGVVLTCAVAACIVTGCTPALNWRDTVVGDSGAVSLFPCRPDEATRAVRLAGTAVQMHLRSCAAAGLQFGIADAELTDAASAASAASELRQAAAANIGATRVDVVAATVPGVDPATPAVGLRLAGQRPGRTAVEERVVLFTVGSHVLQASVVGDRLDDDAADTFFGGLKVPG